MITRTAALIIILVTSLNCAYASTAEVLQVYNGDTLNVAVQGEKIKIRLYGIDAPESGQHGNVAATRFLLHMVLAHPLEIRVIATDPSGERHAIVIREGKESSVNAAMVGNGYAWVNPDHCKADDCRNWKKLETQSRKLRLGIWSGYDLVPPWKFKQPQN